MLGNDGTFALAQRSSVPSAEHPGHPQGDSAPQIGAHSAVLNIDDPKTKGLDGSMMAVVAAGEAFPASSTIVKTGVAKRNEAQRFYVTVPAGAKALELSMSGRAAGSQTRFLAFHPYGLPQDSTSTPQLLQQLRHPRGERLRPEHPGLRQPAARCLGDPRRVAPDIAGARQSLHPDSQAARRHRRPGHGDARQCRRRSGHSRRVAGDQRVRRCHRDGPGRAAGSAKWDRPTIAEGAQQTYTVEVPARSTGWTSASASRKTTPATSTSPSPHPGGQAVR